MYKTGCTAKEAAETMTESMTRLNTYKNILINPETEREYENVPVKVAAEYLDIAPGLIRHGLIEKTLPIGTAFPPQSEGGKWKFNIPIARLKAYANAADLNQAAEISEKLDEVLKLLKPA